ncbi:hypothetical protein BTR23_00910 [Alkalihalophilus pseudofirmus]|uniref:50S ribosomal protein L11 methyltransferase n=1 Tax=Alkalihalobacterium alkalinitrilicum TaxID=427920 RepID=UPI00094CCDDC|nr:50S ribosomal protein L11 methyltransferase [Alkalihalobacterium alkalinitrilicum]OLO42605.1 hypothetical protein BTR23_00910 [Alkalihalophilus pseudofirmus]
MAKQLTIKVSGENIDEVMEQLNAIGIINLYYEQPFEPTVTENGYGFELKKEEDIHLHIIVEHEQEVKETVKKVCKVLGVVDEEVMQTSITLNVNDADFEDIHLKNDWKICYGETVENRRENTIYLDPQGAFGTGIHETTQDSLQMILDDSLDGCEVLDIGTGSGVLAIAASLKGAENVTAIDIEPVEREVSHQAKLNEVTNVYVKQLDIVEDKYDFSQCLDWVIINIGADETIKIIEQHRLYDCTNFFLISGVVDWNEDKVKKYLRDLGFEVSKRKQTNEWVTTLYKRA